MTTAQTSGRILRREHIVAATLVGAVVVVLGFASGIGVRQSQASGTQPPQQAAPGNTPGNEPPLPQAPPEAPPQIPLPGEQPLPVVPIALPPQTVPIVTPVPTVPPSVPEPSPGPPHNHPSPPPGSPTPPPPGPPPTPPCQPGWVPVWLDTATGTVQQLPLLGGLAGGLLSVLPLPSATDPSALPPGTPLDQLLLTCEPAPPAPPVPATDPPR
ncbi:hypothetical protein [Herbihabitans rhizosphaerae]|uniref:hypothetical protein n=1 Tax=Herbihabitans rhizosphaerae TaxID=1872711 RepID=UPI00102C7861|nr:hypothetical protein [Herbihabitans rhizosphaerae]